MAKSRIGHLSKPAHELAALSDEDLVRYVASAKVVGARDDAVTGTHVLLDRHEVRMRHRVALRLPKHLAHHADTVAEWVLERVSRSALRLPLEGGSVGEWVNWWGTAIDRQVISFWRSAQGQSLEAEVSLPSEREGDEDGWRDTLGEELDIDSLLSRVCYAEAIEAVFESMDNDTHVGIVKAAYWEDLPSAEVAEHFDTSAQNVDKVKSRFRERLRAELERRGITEP